MDISKFSSSVKPESKIPKRNPILLVGIGIFSWIGIGSIAFLFEKTLKDIFLNIGISPHYTVILESLTDFSIYIIGVTLLVKVIKSNKFSDWKIFLSSILLLIIGQVLQFLEPLINSKLSSDKYLNNLKQYFDFLKENPEYYTISVLGSFLIWITVALIIYIKKDSV